MLNGCMPACLLRVHSQELATDCARRMPMRLQLQVLPTFQLAVRIVGCAHVKEVIRLAKQIRKGCRIQARLLVKGRHPKLPPVAAVRCTYGS